MTSICIAVLKYKLYGIDIVISKAVLYGTLIAFVTAVYAALVLGVGTVRLTLSGRCLSAPSTESLGRPRTY